MDVDGFGGRQEIVHVHVHVHVDGSEASWGGATTRGCAYIGRLMRRSGSVLFFAAVSVALHLAWVVLMPKGQGAIQPAAHWVEVSFESEPAASLEGAVAAEPTSEEPQAEASAPQPKAAQPEALAAQPKAAPPEPRKKEQLAKAKEPRPDSDTPRPEAAAPSQPEPSQLSAAAPAPAKATQLAIMPRAAALSLDAFAPNNGLRCGNRVSEGQSDCAPSAAEIGQAAQSALNRNLDAAAHSVRHLKEREHPKLKRRSDGSYAYDGHVFQALVRPDGNVEFRDNAVEGELRVSPVPFVFTADLNDLVERHVLGRELYSAEKQWLLDETRALRDQLASEYRRRELQGANRELERTLRGVLDDSKLTLAKKHEAIFLLWQDCGEDAVDHRHAVDRFVRRYMPKGSAVGFLADELEHFNNSRKGLQKFQPYAGS